MAKERVLRGGCGSCKAPEECPIGSEICKDSPLFKQEVRDEFDARMESIIPKKPHFHNGIISSTYHYN
jgi:hypothetical protein